MFLWAWNFFNFLWSGLLQIPKSVNITSIKAYFFNVFLIQLHPKIHDNWCLTKYLIPVIFYSDAYFDFQNKLSDTAVSNCKQQQPDLSRHISLNLPTKKYWLGKFFVFTFWPDSNRPSALFVKDLNNPPIFSFLFFPRTLNYKEKYKLLCRYQNIT